MSTTLAGDYATFTFNGTAVGLYGGKRPNHGKFRVSLDGGGASWSYLLPSCPRPTVRPRCRPERAPPADLFGPRTHPSRPPDRLGLLVQRRVQLTPVVGRRPVGDGRAHGRADTRRRRAVARRRLLCRHSAGRRGRVRSPRPLPLLARWTTPGPRPLTFARACPRAPTGTSRRRRWTTAPARSSTTRRRRRRRLTALTAGRSSRSSPVRLPLVCSSPSSSLGS